MVNYIKNGNSFSQAYGCGVVSIYSEISKEEYQRLIALSKNELEKEITADLGQEIFCGYGYYGCGIAERDNKYYAFFNKGTSCD